MANTKPLASQVKYKTETVHSALDRVETCIAVNASNSVRVSNYAALRAYTGSANIVDVTDDGIFGRFTVITTPDVDNGGTVIVGTDGRKWKRNYDGRVNIKWFGVRASNSATVNNLFFASAIAHVGSTKETLYIPAGVYAISQGVSVTTDLHIEGDGDSSILNFNGTVTGDSALKVSGSLTALPALSVSSIKNSNSFVFVNPPDVVSGDTIVVYNPTYSGFREVYRAGEWCEVSGVSGNTATISHPLYDTYSASAVNMYKMVSPSVSLRNFKITGTSVENLITITLCHKPVVENVTGYLENNSVLMFDRCVKAAAINLNLYNKGDGGDDYGLSIANSQHVQVIGGNYYARRHSTTTGGSGEIACVPCRDIKFIGLTIKNDINSGVFSADMHGNTEDSVYEDCSIYGGGTWQGKNNRYVNCTISDMLTHQTIYSSEIKGGTFILENCNLIVTGDPSGNGRGIIDIGGNSLAVTNNTVEPSTFVVKNCKVSAPNATAITTLVLFKNQGGTRDVNFEIDGILGTSIPAFGQILYTTNLSGTASSRFIIIDGISAFPFGTLLHNAENSNYTSFPHRCQPQSAQVDMVASAGSDNTIGSPRQFRYPYPKPPVVHASSIGTYAGNRLAMASLEAVTNGTLTLRLDSPDATNWTSTVTRRVCWTARLDEL